MSCVCLSAIITRFRKSRNFDCSMWLQTWLVGTICAYTLSKKSRREQQSQQTHAQEGEG